MAEPFLHVLSEGGQELLLTDRAADALVARGLVFYCQNCECYHLYLNRSWSEVDKALLSHDPH